MGENNDGRGFFPSLSRMAFTRAVFQSNVFLPKLNAMRIPVSFHTALKTAKLLAFLDSGATKCFVSQRFIDTHKLRTHLMTVPWKLQNADGSPNARGGLTHFTELEVFTGDVPHVLRFYIANMGPDDLVLGYPWFAVTNAKPDWATGMFPASVTIQTKGAVCYDLFPFLLIYFLFCLSLCAAPCLALFAFLCACFIAYLCVVLGHILHDT